MENLDIKLENTILRNVLIYLGDHIRNLGFRNFDQIDDFHKEPLWIAEKIFPSPNSIIFEDYKKKEPKELDKKIFSPIRDVIIITGYQLQVDTVLVNFQYLKKYEYLTLELANNLLERFSKEPPFNRSRNEIIRGKAGRPHFTEDIWAWEQLHMKQLPMNEVFHEWKLKVDQNPYRKDYKDYRRQFNRITKLNWRTK